MTDDELLSGYTEWLKTQEPPATPPPAPESYVQAKNLEQQNVMPQRESIMGPLANIDVNNTYAQAIPKGYIVGGEVKYNQDLGQQGVLSPFIAGNRFVSGDTSKNSITGAGLEYQNNGLTVGVRHDVNGVMRPNVNTVQQQYGNVPERGTRDPFMQGNMQPQKNLTQFYVSKAF